MAKLDELMDQISSEKSQAKTRRYSGDEFGSSSMNFVKSSSDKKASFRKLSESLKYPIYRIVITGGPCAGKTTALSHMQSHLQSIGHKVFIVPEAATLLMKGGFLIDNKKFTDVDAALFQTFLIRTQIALEDIFLEFAVQNNF